MQFIKKNFLLSVFVGLLFLNGWILYDASRVQGSGLLTFSVLDIGQGDAIFIESPTGNQVIVDGGPGPAILRELGKVMPFGDRSLGLLVVTNPDKDHYAGFLDVFLRYDVGAVAESGTHSPTSLYESLKKGITNERAEHFVFQKGDKVDLGGGAFLEILFPDRDVSNWSSNDGSLVMRLVYGSTSVMLTGDSTARIEQYLAKTNTEGIKADILKAGHHGSRTSSSYEFVKKVAPTLALISAGKENSYGHPHPETLATFKTLGVPYRVTAEEGALTYVSDGQTWRASK